MDTAWHALGQPRVGGTLLIGDHAANMVPSDVDLRLSHALLDQHVALDIGVAEMAASLVAAGAVDAAVLGRVSRLVIDLNRETDHDGLIPRSSDGHVIAGNAALTKADRDARIVRFYRPYHDHLAGLINTARPALILSLHSFTPQLAAHPEQARPWDIGILYNQDDRLVAPAIASLTSDGWTVGDQLPYSGKILNATMNRHSEANQIPYIGVEMRQDHCQSPSGQAKMTKSLTKMLATLRNRVA